tara:strand:- start:14662 stop:14958 length:297 start_codon:yes stop_codon:yes gene_type:complete
MNVAFHPRVRKDIREIVDYYDQRSDTAGDRFIGELNELIDKVRDSPKGFHPADERRRRCNLKKFPYHFLYELVNKEQTIRILVVRHDKRHPSFGLRRQ